VSLGRLLAEKRLLEPEGAGRRHALNPTERSADAAVEGQFDVRKLVRAHADVDRLQERQPAGFKLQNVLAPLEAVRLDAAPDGSLELVPK